VQYLIGSVHLAALLPGIVTLHYLTLPNRSSFNLELSLCNNRMSGFGSSLQLQDMANRVRSSLGASATETFTDSSSNSQQRRLLATDDTSSDSDSDETNLDSESNSITKFASALGNYYYYLFGFHVFCSLTFLLPYRYCRQ
jgi:hypothetical protein